MTPVPILDALNRRYATKKFDPARRIPAETWSTLEQSLILTPSSFGLQPWQFLIIGNPEIRSALRAESWGQAQVTDASHLIIFTARTDVTEDDVNAWIACLAEIQGTPPEALASLKSAITGFVHPMSREERHTWNKLQVYLALGQFMTVAATLGIDTCPLEGMNPAGYDRVLGLEGSGFAATVACVAGYRVEDDRHSRLPKARFASSRLIRHI